jgi:hypothetical protein
MSETRTYWLSFVQHDRPEGDRFVGACVIDVTAEEAEDAWTDVALHFPNALPDAEWMAAATRKAKHLGCNPGGKVAGIRLDDQPTFPAHKDDYPHGRLLSKAEIHAIEGAEL